MFSQLLFLSSLWATGSAAMGGTMGQVEHLKDFPVIELRHYTVQEAERSHFALYFETYFPEAFQQMGALIFGQFLERDNPGGFLWIRGFHDMDARAAVNEAFYSGPLWKEHASTMNDRLLDHTNVLLLQPLSPERGLPVLPAVDPLNEGNGASGIVVALIFRLVPGEVEAFARQAEPVFARWRSEGVREASVLVTLDVPNNFPRLPFRTDGPYLVWLGIVKDEETLDSRFRPLSESSLPSLSASGHLRGAPEILILDPTHRSRLRWLPEW